MKWQKKQSHDHYVQHKETVVSRKKEREKNDKTIRRKHNILVQKKMAQDENYKQLNRDRALINANKKKASSTDYVNRKRQYARIYTTKRLVSDLAYKNRNRQRARLNTARRLLQNANYRQKNREAAKVNTPRRLRENATYRQKNREAAKVNKTRRLREDADYLQKNREAAKVNKTRRLRENEACCQKHRQIAKVNTEKRLRNDALYKEQNRKRAHARICQISKQSSYREYQKKFKQTARQKSTNSNKKLERATKISPTMYNTKRNYWIRRSRLLATTTMQLRRAKLQHKMAKQSDIHLLDVKLMFGKAEKSAKRGTAKLKSLHNVLSTKTAGYLELLPDNRLVTAEDLTTAIEDHRYHTSSSELYFWEHSYNVTNLTDKIPIDTDGRAHIFSPLSAKPSSMSSDNTALDSNQTAYRIRRWECHPQLCLVKEEMINGVITLMQRIAIVRSPKCMPFYINLDKCTNPARSDQLGHTRECELGITCQSLLRPARILSCHFPVLRSMVSRLYELRRLATRIHAVQAAMADGDYEALKHTTEELDNLLQNDAGSTSHSDNTGLNDRYESVQETTIIEKFGKALREVTEIRDTYVTNACDLCEQIKSDLNSLKSYEDRKGFSCEKMTKTIELLYQSKTEHEDLDEFLNSMLICKYCADKLMHDKDVARSALNKLQVVLTPACIQQLNVFEKSLIKYYLSCVTVIRLGQISNTSRPQSELNAALKGRIAYLPLDVKSNAEFLPHDVLNTDGLVLLVAGQPTKNKKVWTSVVDLRKVHEALMWLKEHNRFYQDIPAYSVADMERVIADRLAAKGDQQQYCEGALVKKLSDAAKSNLYESFTIQPISNDFPADVMADYQMDKTSGTSANIFDSDLDLKAFPELFPTGENGMRDATREVKIGTSDFIKSRLLNKNAKFRLNINYLFHSFQVQEVSNMCHSVAHKNAAYCNRCKVICTGIL